MSMKRCAKWSVCFLVLFCATTPGSDGLKDVQLDAPDYIRHGEDVTFTCNYDMEKDMLYAVKWYRGSEEFYRFVPKEVPPQQVFSIGRMDVDIFSSTEHQVILRNVSLELSGLYKCVVSAESPFQTLSGIKEVRVVGIGYEGPRLQLDRISYHPGDPLSANCTLEKTFPLPNVTWFLNDRETDERQSGNGYYIDTPCRTNFHQTFTEHFLFQICEGWFTDFEKLIFQRYTGQGGSGPLLVSNSGNPLDATTVSRVNLTLPESFQPTKLSCRVQLFDIYDEMTSKRIQPKPRHFSVTGPDTLPRINNNASAANRINSAQQTSPNHHFHTYYSVAFLLTTGFRLIS